VSLGIEQGHFQLEPTDTAFGLLLSVVGAGLKARLENATMAGIETLTSECVLRMLGLAPEHARALVARTSAQIAKSKPDVVPARGKRRHATRSVSANRR
jgi:hypothetical protein